MNLNSLVLSSDEKTVRVLRRVLGDLDIGIEHCSAEDDVIRRITRNRYEAIIVDCSDSQNAGNVLRAAKAAPVNKRALSVALVESSVGLKGGFDMGAHFVLHKPLAVERAKASFRAVRALMKRERRLQLRVPVQIPVECVGAQRYQAKTLDLCEGGMAIQFKGRRAKESMLRFLIMLPGIEQQLELWGEMAWEGSSDQVGVRFKNLTEDQRNVLRGWLNNQLPENEPDDPPVACRLTDLSARACYVTTSSPFPQSTRVTLSIRTDGIEVRASGIVRITHPEFGMGVEFLQSTSEQQDRVRRLIETLRSNGKSPELQVEPDGLEASAEPESSGEDSRPAPESVDDALVSLFREQGQLSVDAFLQQMQQQRQLQESH
ncbi:MAG TPA: PilZ domain-containing protein [Terriglobia bacterium]|nr:PilZ domain-containing protein [Terriglobia bacterium]